MRMRDSKVMKQEPTNILIVPTNDLLGRRNVAVAAGPAGKSICSKQRRAGELGRWQGGGRDECKQMVAESINKCAAGRM